jgi:hypothetical protein
MTILRCFSIYRKVPTITGKSRPRGHFGGRGAFLRPGNVWLSTDVVEAYDPLSGTWATGPSMLAPRGFLASAGAGGKLFTIDGLTDGA